MAVTVEVKDPETGEPVNLLAYRRSGKLFFKRLPKHLQLDHASPRRLAQLANFGQAAISARGRTGLIDGLPPAAVAVREFASRRSAPLDGTLRPDLRTTQERLRELVPAHLQDAVDKLSRLRVGVRLQDPNGPAPRRDRPRR